MTHRLPALLLLVVVLLSGAAGCKSKSVSNEQTGVPTGTPVATSSVEPTVTDEVDGSGDVSEPSGSTAAKPVDASAIEKELAAIEKELDSLSMPDDSDFSAIEGDLP